METYQVKQESVTTAADSILHAIMGNGGRSVGNGDQEVHLSLLLPPVVPSRLVSLALADQLPVLIGTPLMPAAEEVGPQGIAAHVLDPQVVQVLEGPG